MYYKAPFVVSEFDGRNSARYQRLSARERGRVCGMGRSSAGDLGTVASAVKFLKKQSLNGTAENFFSSR